MPKQMNEVKSERNQTQQQNNTLICSLSFLSNFAVVDTGNLVALVFAQWFLPSLTNLSPLINFQRYIVGNTLVSGK